MIGVVLAGVSLGNYLGGRLADRWPSRSALVYGAGSLASVAILLLVRYVESLQLPSGAPTILQVLWLTTALFSHRRRTCSGTTTRPSDQLLAPVFAQEPHTRR